MRKREETFLDRIGTVRDFLRAKMPEEPQLIVLRQKFEASAERALALRQPSGWKISRGDHAYAMRSLQDDLRYKHMIRISRHAKPLLRWTKGSESALAVPPKRAPIAEHVDAAQRMAKYLKPHVPLFVSDGFPKNFLAQMRAAAAAIGARESMHRLRVKERDRAEAALRDELRTARALLSAIEGALMDYCRTHAAFAAGWHKALRIGKRMGRPRKRRNPPAG